jgi:hypothetical protein
MKSIEKINAAKPGQPMSDEFIKYLRAELKAQSGQWKRLARISNGELTHAWLVQFANSGIINPHVDKAFVLAKYLGIKPRFEASQHFNRFEG